MNLLYNPDIFMCQHYEIEHVYLSILKHFELNFKTD